MLSQDGKRYTTDAADTETLLRIIQSVPSPKAEPVKQWLAKVGAQRLNAAINPLPVEGARTEIATLTKPDEAAPALSWAEYYEALAALYRRQAVHEAQMRIVESRLDEHEDEIGELHGRMESVEELTRLVSEILERLGPETLTPAHQRWVQGATKRLREVSGAAYPTIYAELGEAFQVAKYNDIREQDWPRVEAWFAQKIAAAKNRR